MKNAEIENLIYYYAKSASNMIHPVKMHDVLSNKF